MAGRKVKTFNGKVIDFDELMAKNETTQAAGNMDVNARGDVIDEKGNVIKSRDEVVREYNKNTSKTVVKSSLLDDIDDDGSLDQPLKDDSRVAQKKAKGNQKQESESSEQEQDKDTVKSSKTTKTSAKTSQKSVQHDGSVEDTTSDNSEDGPDTE